MTASKLEESIERLATKLMGLADTDDLCDCLRAFAEAVWECNCACNKMPPEPQNAECVKCHRAESLLCKECAAREEPKECDHCYCRVNRTCCYCSAKKPKECSNCWQPAWCSKCNPQNFEPPAALPDEVKDCLHQGFNIVDGVVRLCSLCHKYLGLMYPPKGGAGK